MLERPAISSNLTSRNGSPLRPAFSSTASSFKPDSASLGDDVHPIINEGRVAVITGAASGIGRAAALELAKYVIRDLDTHVCLSIFSSSILIDSN